VLRNQKRQKSVLGSAKKTRWPSQNKEASEKGGKRRKTSPETAAKKEERKGEEYRAKKARKLQRTVT